MLLRVRWHCVEWPKHAKMQQRRPAGKGSENLNTTTAVCALCNSESEGERSAYMKMNTYESNSSSNDEITHSLRTEHGSSTISTA